jgi:hypothetical protein
MKYYKQTLTIILILTTTVILYVIAAVYIHDPLQIYHKPFFRTQTFVENFREQNAGIIKHYDFDSVIIGSSLFENTSANEASEKLGGKFVNLAISDGNFYQRYIILNYLFKKKKIKNVIYSFEGYYEKQVKESPDYKLINFDFLYDDNEFNDYKIYFKDKYLFCSLTFSKNCLGKITDLDRPNAWLDTQGAKDLFGDFTNWFKYKDNEIVRGELNSIVYDYEKTLENKSKQIIYDENEIQNAIKYVDDYLITLVKENPDVKFYIQPPPYPRLRWALSLQSKRFEFEQYKAVLKHIINLNLPNLILYGFDNEDFIEDMGNYKDLSHYRPEINSFMIDAIKNNTHILNKDNIQMYLSDSEEKIIKYDIKKYYDLIKENGV